MVKKILVYWRDIPSQVIVCLPVRMATGFDEAGNARGPARACGIRGAGVRGSVYGPAAAGTDSCSRRGRSLSIMYRMRLWSVRRARWLKAIYAGFEWLLLKADPLLRRIGYDRLDRPFVRLEQVTKGFLLDSQNCGQCIVGFTGLSCPMNCPKKMRNGPCGGVRADGGCEVKPDMACVWVLAWEGNKRMKGDDRPRLGLGVGRQQTNERRRPPDPGCAAAGRPSIDRSLGMAARAAPQKSLPGNSRRQ